MPAGCDGAGADTALFFLRKRLKRTQLRGADSQTDERTVFPLDECAEMLLSLGADVTVIGRKPG